MEPTFETGNFDKNNYDPTKPLKPAISKSRQSQGSDKRRSFSRTKSPDVDVSPRRKVFEAKYEKFLANKHQKDAIEKRVSAMKAHDFDITTRNQQSPSKRSGNFRGVVGAELKHTTSGRYEADELLPPGYEQHLLKEELLHGKKRDPFKVLGVSAEDKMTFFLLKWVFNAIKQTSDVDDPKLKGKKFMRKAELVQQLSKNVELMEALGIANTKQLNAKVKAANCCKDGCLTWEEFLGFFFMQDGSVADQADNTNWWNNIDENGNQIKAESDKKNKSQKSEEALSEMLDGDESSGNKRDRKRGHKFI